MNVNHKRLVDDGDSRRLHVANQRLFHCGFHFGAPEDSTTVETSVLVTMVIQIVFSSTLHSRCASSTAWRESRICWYLDFCFYTIHPMSK